MSQISVRLSPALRDQLDGVAHRFHRSRGAIARRALEHYLLHVLEVERAGEAPHGSTQTDWKEVKATLCAASCPYEECPFSGSCPVEVCPL